MGASDDHQHSVRVEVEAGTNASDDVSSDLNDLGDGPPAWVVVLAVLVVGLVGAGFLLLRPGDDAAADGTESESAAVDGGEAEDGTSDTEVAVAVLDSLVPTRVLLGGERALRVLADDRGFVALVEGSGPTPMLLRSVDGEDWFETNTTVTVDGAVNDQNLEWFALSRTDSSLVLTAAPVEQDGFPQGQVFTSADGSDWQRLEGFGSTLPGSSSFPVAFSSDSAFSFEFLGLRVFTEILTEYTNLELPESGICNLTPDPPANGLNFVGCSGELLETLDGSRVVGDVPASEVLACLNDLRSFTSATTSFVRRNLNDSNDRTDLFDLQPIALPVTLQSGRVALPDGGSFVSESPPTCDGLISLPGPAEPAMVIVDPDVDEVSRWPYPDSGSDDLPSFLVQPLGEFITSSGAPVLLTAYDDQLWALNVDTGEWTGPLSDMQFPLTGFGGSVIASESGNRVFSTSEGAFTVIDVFEDANSGAISVREQTMPIDLENAAALEFSGGILYAEDDIVFVSDGAILWTLEPPERVGVDE